MRAVEVGACDYTKMYHAHVSAALREMSLDFPTAVHVCLGNNSAHQSERMSDPIATMQVVVPVVAAVVTLVIVLGLFFCIRANSAAEAKGDYESVPLSGGQEDAWPLGRGGNSDHDPAVVRKFATALNTSFSDASRMLDEAVSSSPSEIEPRLLLGNAACSKDRTSLLAARVTHVLNATSTLANHFESDDSRLTYLRVPVEDSLAANLGVHLDDAVDWIAEALGDPYATGSVLVHCQQGVSRSATIVLAFLMRERGHSLVSALEHVDERRWIRPNESFLEQLQKYETALETRRRLN